MAYINGEKTMFSPRVNITRESVEIVQETGDSEDVVMSQKAVTEELNKKLSTEDIVQNTGDSETLVMSQKIVTDKLNEKLNSERIRFVNINNTTLEAGALNYSTGNTTTDNNVLRSNGFIVVEPNTLYQIYSERLNFKDTQYIFEYDENKVFIRYQGMSVAVFGTGITTHENCRYIKTRTQTDGVDYEICPLDTRIMVEKGNEKTMGFDKAGIVPICFTDSLKVFADGLNKVNVNNSSLELGNLSYSNGNPTVNNSILRSNNFIGVEPNTLYQIYSERLNFKDTQYIFEYDKNKVFIRYQGMNAAKFESGITTSETCKYIKTRTQTDGVDYELCSLNTRIMVEKGEKKSYSFDGVYSNNFVIPMKTTESEEHSLIPYIEPFKNSLMLIGYDIGFLAVTDTHTTNPSIFEAMAYFASNNIGDFVVHMGDYTADKTTKEAKAELLKSLFDTARTSKGTDIYLLRGNHDNNYTSANSLDENYHISDNEFYNLATRNAKNVVKEYPCNYFYRDFNEYKIRVIFLDSGDIYREDGTMYTTGLNVLYQQKQIDWLVNKALNFTDKTDKNEWAVISIAHSNLTPVNHIFNAFLNGSSYSGTYDYPYHAIEPKLIVDLSCDFTNQGAMEYIGHISGHLHNDAINSIADMSPARYNIEIRNGVDLGVAEPNYENIAMDFITINKSTRTINTFRIGTGENRNATY